MTRRRFLSELAKTVLVSTTVMGAARIPARRPELVTLFLCGDVMTGRGVDQILPYPSVPRIHEQYMRSARGYVALAEEKNGRITTPVDFAYIWGDAFAEFERAKPDVRIINLETSVTTSDEWVRKGINYRMHPDNIACLSAAKIDCCALANNHVLDWGEAGLIETLETLEGVGVKWAGAGRDFEEAGAPAILEVGGKGRVIVFAFGTVTSGIPSAWAASKSRPGVSLLQNLSDGEIQRIAGKVHAVKRRGDLVVASVHWGSNWGYRIQPVQRAFAHKLLDEARVDIIHGHSSHHPKGIGNPYRYAVRRCTHQAAVRNHAELERHPVHRRPSRTASAHHGLLSSDKLGVVHEQPGQCRTEDASHDRGDQEVAGPFSVSGNHVPGSRLCAAFRQRIFEGGGVFVPEGTLRVVGFADFPVLFRVVDPFFEAFELFVTIDVKIELENRRSRVLEESFEPIDVIESL